MYSTGRASAAGLGRWSESTRGGGLRFDPDRESCEPERVRGCSVGPGWEAGAGGAAGAAGAAGAGAGAAAAALATAAGVWGRWGISIRRAGRGEAERVDMMDMRLWQVIWWTRSERAAARTKQSSMQAELSADAPRTGPTHRRGPSVQSVPLVKEEAREQGPTAQRIAHPARPCG